MLVLEFPVRVVVVIDAIAPAHAHVHAATVVSIHAHAPVVVLEILLGCKPGLALDLVGGVSLCDVVWCGAMQCGVV
jgi:hypothetical protein